jgi:mannitol/fructose-specific phosphotransferase system IIA component (Ntr-type)
VNLARYLTEERIDLALGEHFDEERPATHERLVERMAALLVTSPDIVNATKLGNDLVNRERRAPSLPGHGVALPHVRTLQARRLVMAVGICRVGLALPTPDEEPVRLVIALVGPPYDDKAYLGVYRTLGERLQQPEWTHSILSADLPGEVLRAMATA